MKNINLQELQIAPGETFQNLTTYPLRSLTSIVPNYLILDEAIEQKLVTITETSEQGNVPSLSVINTSERPIFILDGEELVGAKQNRVVNLTILVAPLSTLTIPVSCVEQGRWRYRSSSFTPSNRSQYASGRHKKMQQVTRNISTKGDRSSNQGEIWRDISLKLNSFETASQTMAMGDIYEENALRIEDYVKGFKHHVNQVGEVFAINGQIVGLEFFDSAITCEKLLPKLIRSYAFDALEQQTSFSPTKIEDAQKLLSEINETEINSFPATGMGEDIRMKANNLTGAGLVVEERLVHLSVFRG